MQKIKLNKLKKVIYKLEMLQSRAKDFGFSEEDSQIMKVNLKELKDSYNILRQESLWI